MAAAFGGHGPFSLLTSSCSASFLFKAYSKNWGFDSIKIMSESCNLDGINVLIAEDSPETLLVLKKALETRGATVNSAEDGQLALVRELTAQVDVMIMDIQLPRLSGLDVVTRLRKEGVNTPIIALTGHEEVEHRNKCLDAGCNEYFIKPVDTNHLCRRIKALAAVE